jgi:hypothetical protein
VDTVLLHRVYYTLVVIEHGTRRAARASLFEVEHSSIHRMSTPCRWGAIRCSLPKNFPIMH